MPVAIDSYTLISPKRTSETRSAGSGNRLVDSHGALAAQA